MKTAKPKKEFPHVLLFFFGEGPYSTALTDLVSTVAKATILTSLDLTQKPVRSPGVRVILGGYWGVYGGQYIVIA